MSHLDRLGNRRVLRFAAGALVTGAVALTAPAAALGATYAGVSPAGVLTVTADDNGQIVNLIHGSTIDGDVGVSVSTGVSPYTGCDSINTSDYVFCEGVVSVRVFLEGGSDTFLSNGAFPASFAYPIIELSGGPGDDSIQSGGVGDSLDAGPGDDTLTFNMSGAAVTVDLAAGTATGQGSDTLQGFEHVIGTFENDVLRGDAGANQINAREGDDFVAGRGGDDVLTGHDDTDRLSYVGFDDGVRLDLEAGTAVGPSSGADTLATFEHVTGSQGDDAIAGDSGPNILDGDGGDDMIEPRAGDDFPIGGNGSDTVSYAGAPGPVNAVLADFEATGDGYGDSDIYLLNDIESLRGGEGDDHLEGDGLANTLAGGPGDDDLIGRGGPDTLDLADAAQPVRVDLRLGISTGADTGTDALTSIENVVAGTGHDVLAGDQAANSIHGGPGDDHIEPGAGDDDVSGGPGTDRLSFAPSPAPVTADLMTGRAAGHGSDSFTSIEHLRGSRLGDLLAGDRAANVIEGWSGPDHVRGRGGSDTLIGGTARDLLFGGPGADRLAGGGGRDRLAGQAGADTLLGGRGADLLIGGFGRDRLFGGASPDRLMARDRRRDRAVACGPGRRDLAIGDKRPRDPRMRGCERQRRR